MKLEEGWQKVIKYTKYCHREYNSTLSIDAKKPREISKGVMGRLKSSNEGTKNKNDLNIKRYNKGLL